MIRTYVFDADEWESVYGMAIRQDFYLLHFFDDDACLGTIKYDGSFTTDCLIKSSDLSSRYWELFE